jgi:hypothetical protein
MQVNSYSSDRTYLETLRLDCDTAMLAAQELFYRHRHATFDVQTPCLFLQASGFPDQQGTRLRRQHA